MRRPASVAAVGLSAVAAVLALLGVGGCGGAEAGAGGVSATTAPDGDVVVELHDRDVRPGDVEVPVGATVRWENLDPVEHELVSFSGDVIRSPVLGQAASYEVRFDAPGEHPYYCNIHNYMKGTVVVR